MLHVLETQGHTLAIFEPFLNCLLPALNILAVSQMERQELKAQVSKKTADEGDARFLLG